MNSLQKRSRSWSKQATWLLPGLSIKRWLGMTFFGLFFLLTGLALLLNLRPVSSTLEFFQKLAPYLPSVYTGPVLVILGFVLLYVGFAKAYNTVFSVVTVNGQESGILEALYRRHKLDHGPQVVAIGGGTGLSTLLRGVKRYTSNITAIVTVGDDGGSSGRLREEQGIIPPGDIRNCIAALADEEKLITELFQYRFQNGQGLEGHSFGNLFLTAMCRITGDMVSAIKESSKVLNIRGRVFPSTLDNISLVAEMEDGTVVRGESHIPEAKKKIARLTCDPSNPKPLPDTLDAIRHADLILLGPGSLYTSVLPNLLIDEIAHAISKSTAPKVYIANVMTQPGETDGFSVSDHLRTILEHTPYPNMVDCVFVNSWLPDELIERYRKAGCEPVALDMEQCRQLGVKVVQSLFIDESETKMVRHNPKRLARSIIHWFKREYGRQTKLKKNASRTLTPRTLMNHEQVNSESQLTREGAPI